MCMKTNGGLAVNLRHMVRCSCCGDPQGCVLSYIYFISLFAAFSVAESALDDLDLNNFGVSTLERRLESSSTVGLVLGKTQALTPRIQILHKLATHTPYIS